MPIGATSGAISVTTPAGTATSTASFTVTPAPTLTGFTPTSGPVGATVTLTGSGFTNATAVSFSGSAATFTVDSDTQITAMVPSNATTGPITVTAPGGAVTSATSFTVIPAALTGFTPTSGPVGAVVTLTGTGFAFASGVSFNGAAASFTVDSDTQITAIVPSSASSGLITVTTAGGTATSATSFTDTTPVSTPTPGLVTTATNVQQGGFIGWAWPPVTVTLTATDIGGPGIAATYYTIGSGGMTSYAETGPFTISTPGSNLVEYWSVDNYGFVEAVNIGWVNILTPAAPTIGGFGPASGPVGSSVTLNGDDFTGVSAVTFNGSAATFTVVSGTQIVATVPTGATSGLITVTGPYGAATSATSFTVSPPSYVDTLSALTVNGTPVTGFMAGTTTYNVVLPYGAIFVPIVNATTTDPNATAVITQALSVTGTATVKVAAQDGVSNETYTINFSVAPSNVDTLSGLTVSAGSLSPAFTSSTLSYNDSVANSVANIIVTPMTTDSQAKYVLQVAGATVSKTIALSVGANVIDVVVTAQNGASETYVVTVTRAAPIIPKPTLAAFTPTSGLVGSSVTLTGTNFTGATAVSFNGHPTSFTVRSATQILTRVPSGATSGVIRVTTPGGTATSAARFTVIFKPTLTLKLSGLTSGALRLGKSLTVTGKVTPASLAGGKVTLTVDYKLGTKWVKATSWLRSLTTSGTYSATYKPSKRASYRIEATIAKTATHTAATTAWLAFTVK